MLTIKRYLLLPVLIIYLSACGTDEEMIDPLDACWYFESGQTPIHFRFNYDKTATGHQVGSGRLLNYYTAHNSQKEQVQSNAPLIEVTEYKTDGTIDKITIADPTLDFKIELTGILIKDTLVAVANGSYTLKWCKIGEMRYTIPGEPTETILKKQVIKRIPKFE